MLARKPRSIPFRKRLYYLSNISRHHSLRRKSFPIKSIVLRVLCFRCASCWKVRLVPDQRIITAYGNTSRMRTARKYPTVAIIPWDTWSQHVSTDSSDTFLIIASPHRRAAHMESHSTFYVCMAAGSRQKFRWKKRPGLGKNWLTRKERTSISRFLVKFDARVVTAAAWAYNLSKRTFIRLGQLVALITRLLSIFFVCKFYRQYAMCT